jgi:hypothetical protein
MTQRPPHPVPKTADEWWENFAVIKESIKEWGPRDFPVSQIVKHPRSRILFGNEIVDALVPHKDKDIWEVIEEWEKNRDSLVWHFCQSVWIDAPDKPYIHEWSNWHYFCDLCSEGPHLLDLDQDG